MPNLCALSAASASRSTVGATTLRERSTPGSPPTRADITSKNDSNNAASLAVTGLLCTVREPRLWADVSQKLRAGGFASLSNNNFRELAL